MHALHHLVRVDAASLQFAIAHTVLLVLDGGIEGSQTVQLHGHAVTHQLGQTLDDLRQHTIDDGSWIRQSVVYHVLHETALRQRLAVGHLGKVFTITQRLRTALLRHCQLQYLRIFCHNF